MPAVVAYGWVPMLEISSDGSSKILQKPRYICRIGLSPTPSDDEEDEAKPACYNELIAGEPLGARLLSLRDKLLVVIFKERQLLEMETIELEIITFFNYLAVFCPSQSLIRAIKIDYLVELIASIKSPNWTNHTQLQARALKTLRVWRSEINRGALTIAERKANGVLPSIENRLRGALALKRNGWLQELSSALSTLEANETPLQSSVVLAQVDVCLTDFHKIDDDELKSRAARLLCKWEKKWEEGQKPKPPSASSTSVSSSVLPKTDPTGNVGMDPDNSTRRTSQRNQKPRQRYNEECWKDWSAVDLEGDILQRSGSNIT